MADRKRMTWNRKASLAPADPGYGVSDQGHPAHLQEDPKADKYMNGDPSSWAEDPRKPPYPDGNDPADPGYGVADQDHPAHKKQPTWPMIELQKVANLRKAVEKKAAKCVHIAKAMLGKEACEMAIEDQALDLMDIPDAQLDATLARLGGGFMAEDEVEVEEDLDDILAAADKDDDEVKEKVDGDKVARLLAEINALKAKVAGLSQSADQNDPNGPTLGASGETVEQVKKEEEAIEKQNDGKNASVTAWLNSMDADRDGFITKEDWTGSRKLFASLDTDKDNILAVDEATRLMLADEEVEEEIEEEDEPTTAAMLAEMTAKKAEDEKEEVVVEEKKEEASKKADDEKPENEAEEVEEEKKEEASSKKADEFDMFVPVDDPMGLGDVPADLPTDDDAILDEIFGCKTAKKAEDKEEVKEEVVEEKKEEASKKASERPQPQKPHQGPKTLGAVTKTASAIAEEAELSKLWASDPDVSVAFGLKK